MIWRPNYISHGCFKNFDKCYKQQRFDFLEEFKKDPEEPVDEFDLVVTATEGLWGTIHPATVSLLASFAAKEHVNRKDTYFNPDSVSQLEHLVEKYVEFVTQVTMFGKVFKSSEFLTPG